MTKELIEIVRYGGKEFKNLYYNKSENKIYRHNPKTDFYWEPTVSKDSIGFSHCFNDKWTSVGGHGKYIQAPTKE